MISTENTYIIIIEKKNNLVQLKVLLVTKIDVFCNIIYSVKKIIGWSTNVFFFVRL